MQNLTATVSLSRKVNLGGYESADVFLSISGVSAETTQGEIDSLLEGPCALAYKSIAVELHKRCVAAKEAK